MLVFHAVYSLHSVKGDNYQDHIPKLQDGEGGKSSEGILQRPLSPGPPLGAVGSHGWAAPNFLEMKSESRRVNVGIQGQGAC